jgi:hypothetical protein
MAVLVITSVRREKSKSTLRAIVRDDFCLESFQAIDFFTTAKRN